MDAVGTKQNRKQGTGLGNKKTPLDGKNSWNVSQQSIWQREGSSNTHQRALMDSKESVEMVNTLDTLQEKDDTFKIKQQPGSSAGTFSLFSSDIKLKSLKEWPRP